MRIFVFSLLFLIALLLPIWAFIPCAIAYVLWKPGYELMGIGIIIDSQFGMGSIPLGYVYTLSLGVLVLGAEFLKPHLSFYNAE